MRFSRAAAYAAFAGCVGTSVAHNIALKAHTRECFHEELHKDDKMTVTFQVGDREFGGAGNLEIDFYVHGQLSLERWT
jgi:p24 family protein beta-1